jgi:3-oxoacyl-[acyl-carrier-protein] synthase II
LHKRRVVVTGLGMVSPLGLSVASTWEAILQGRSGAAPLLAPEFQELRTRFSCSVKNFVAENYLPAKDARKNDTFILFALAAAEEAMRDAELVVTPENCYRMGVAIGSGIGGIPMIESNHQELLAGGPRKVSPFFIPGAIINLATGQVSIRHGLRGPSLAIVTACSTGNHNIGYAMRTITYGDADVMLAGGTEMATTPLGLAGFSACRALSTRNEDPARASRPWDKSRDGFVLGDGAGVLVLEEYEHARRRGARIYAELLGFGMSSDAYHITAPDTTGEGAMIAMQQALKDAALSPTSIQYINAHATSTPAGDKVEAIAIRRAFATHADRLAVSSTKSMTGHLLGAAGAVEAIFSVLALRDQVAPPTINLDEPEEGCDLDFVPHEARAMKIKAVLSNSNGFGGVNSALVFRQLD